jgi:hypothetical protein
MQTKGSALPAIRHARHIAQQHLLARDRLVEVHGGLVFGILSLDKLGECPGTLQCFGEFLPPLSGRFSA